jgi:hypothetical protein
LPNFSISTTISITRPRGTKSKKNAPAIISLNNISKKLQILLIALKRAWMGEATNSKISIIMKMTSTGREMLKNTNRMTNHSIVKMGM